MIKVLINGCNGKMGQELAKAIEIAPDIETLCGFDRQDTGDNKFPVFTNINDINLIPDVIIDFSIPIATFNILEFAKKHNIPTVVATTGFSNEELEKIKEYSKLFPIFHSSNMSYEINLMSKLVAELAKKLSDSDIEIIETHHNRKIDSPSGTALMLANSINNALDMFLGNDETFEITHNVTSRSVFASGAVKAAKFVVLKTPGLYNMNDLV